MKNLSIILTALTAGTAPLLPQTAPETKEIVQPAATEAERSGKEALREIRQTYDKGGYAEFLKELDDSYKALKESGQLKPLAEMRLGSSPKWQEFEARVETLQNERNQELLDAIDTQKKTPFIEKVISATANLFDKEQRQATDKIANLRGMAPGTGKNSDENLLIDLDLEYEYKSLHIDLPGGAGIGRREMQCALKMEQLDKMLSTSSDFEDDSLNETVALFAENFDESLAQNWDIFDLNALAAGKRKPLDALEDKVASILTRYQEKFSDLWREFLEDNEKK
jgi:hypothetical protein